MSDQEFACSICRRTYVNPGQCIGCEKNFCQSCIKGIINRRNRCPVCKTSPFTLLSINPVTRKSDINSIEFGCPNRCGAVISSPADFEKHCAECAKSKLRCIKCKYVGPRELFWAHLIESHKEQIIREYSTVYASNYDAILEGAAAQKKDKNNAYRNQLNNLAELDICSNTVDYKNKFRKIGLNNIAAVMKKNYLNNNSDNMANVFGTPTHEGRYQKIMGSLRSFNNPSVRHAKYGRASSLSRSCNTELIAEKIEVNPLKNLVYCGLRTNLNCSCCPFHFCTKGSCLCPRCMKTNKANNFLPSEALINKSGYVTFYRNGRYYCNRSYKRKILEKFGAVERTCRCEYPQEPCEDCKSVLTLETQYKLAI